MNLFISYQNKHNKEHNFIKNYIWEIHNEKYSSYCIKCNKNICSYCKDEHKEHEITNYENILPNKNDVQNN